MAIAPMSRRERLSSRKSQAMMTVNNGLLVWNVLAFAGPSFAMESKKNQRPR
nr:hypothetical protein [Rubrobacter marinus]